MPSNDLREAVIEAARAYLGVPWVHQGRTRKGIDCLGLPVCVAHDLGWTTLDYTAYAERKPNWPHLFKLIAQCMDKINPAEMGLADVLVFQCNQMPHVAIVGDKGAPWSLIHSHQGAGKVVEAIYDTAWVQRVRGCIATRPLARRRIRKWLRWE